MVDLSASAVARRVLAHMLTRLAETPAIEEPFGHIYLTDVLPADVYTTVLATLPAPEQYVRAAERHHAGEAGSYVRSQFALKTDTVDALATPAVWRGVAAALTSPELKQAVFARLANDLAYRYGIAPAAVPELAGFSRPTLYRETEGFEIPPHPDTRKKVVTMHLYFPADESQTELGTALYRRRALALPVGDWRRRFEKVKQFAFLPNSGYAFVVNNTLWKKSWHGRERLPEGAGVRNTLLNTFYETPRDGYSGYLPEVEPMRRAA